MQTWQQMHFRRAALWNWRQTKPQLGASNHPWPSLSTGKKQLESPVPQQVTFPPGWCCHRECLRNLNSCWQASSSCGQPGEPWEVFFHSIVSGHRNLRPHPAEVSGISRCPRRRSTAGSSLSALQTKALGNPSRLCSSGDCKEPLLRLSNFWWPTWVGAGKGGQVGSPGVGAGLSSQPLSRGAWRRQTWDCQRCVSHSNLQREKGSQREGGQRVYPLGSEACWD